MEEEKVYQQGKLKLAVTWLGWFFFDYRGRGHKKLVVVPSLSQLASIRSFLRGGEQE